jgi:hypothetical protein
MPKPKMGTPIRLRRWLNQPENAVGVWAALAVWGAVVSVPALIAATFLCRLLAARWLGPNSDDVIFGSGGTAFNWLELLYFTANIIAVITALITLLFVRKQTELTANSAQFGVYRHLYNDIMTSEILVGGKKLCQRLRAGYLETKNSGSSTLSLGEYAAARVRAMEETKSDDFEDMIGLISYFEIMGLQIRRGYLHMDDVYYLLKGIILSVDAIFGQYLREESKDTDGLWEHALWLFDKIADYEPANKLAKE